MKTKNKIYSILYYVGLFVLLGLPIFVGLTLQVVDGTTSNIVNFKVAGAPPIQWSAYLSVAVVAEVFWLIPALYFVLPKEVKQ